MCNKTLQLYNYVFLQREREERAKHLEEKKAQLAAAMEEAKLQEQAHRNAIRAQQEVAEIRAYKKAYGKV